MSVAPFLSRGDFEGGYFLRFLTASNLAYSVVLTAGLKLRLVELRRRSVTAGVVGDHIFSDYFVEDFLEVFQSHMDAFINVLRQQYQDNLHHFRSERLCFLDHVFSRQWFHHYPEFKSEEGYINGLGRRLPGGAWDYHAGIVPSFCQSMKVWGLDEDDIYAPVNFMNEHWIAIWISIPKRNIVCRAGDCGVFGLKYIECHALGMSFPPALCNKNSKAIREKIALDIIKETPEGHAKENEDNDENLATYDQQDDLTEDLLDDLSWSHKYPEFKSDKGDINGLGRRLPSGAWNYHAGMVPTFCQSMKVWGLDVDDIYAPVNFRNEHWIAIWISTPKRHIIVWDSILTHIKAADLDVLMEPFVNMFCNKNAKAIREKMALVIFQETPEGHAIENEDNDENI
ncbi:hypothetical protein F2Q68_00021472 [Brassica cretica]|uniref:Ubiquitin-like protease family profile domain-containing protein n=1 Tax=Brassica cretica TaxID=69181 RepID=A0A8S9G6B7_BRACR|nr:hypothetical protein F2Q68_00021472 [Brassica cretica]